MILGKSECLGFKILLFGSQYFGKKSGFISAITPKKYVD